MIDLLIGIILGVIGTSLIHHFRATGSLKLGTLPTLETILEGFRQIMTQAAQDILGKLDAIPAQIEAKVTAAVADMQAQLDAEKAAHAEDLAAISAKVDAVAPPAG